MTNPKGATFERLVADYLDIDNELDIDRQVKTGRRDRGDIRGVRLHGKLIAVECKNTAHPVVGPALKEAETERENIQALAGVVVAKRHGKGKAPDQVVYMTLRDFKALITGVRDD